MEASDPSHLAVTFTAPPPLVASTVRAASCAWMVSICCCIRCACFINFPMLDIIQIVFRTMLSDAALRSSANFDQSALENFQGFLDQRVVFEIVLAEGRRLGGCGCWRACGRGRFGRSNDRGWGWGGRRGNGFG